MTCFHPAALLLETIPTPKAFKKAISSISPEQQRFAKAYGIVSSPRAKTDALATACGAIKYFVSDSSLVDDVTDFSSTT
jgi:hypothetical protein